MTEQVSSSELLDWFRKSLSSSISQAERERDKLIAEITRAFNSVTDFIVYVLRDLISSKSVKKEPSLAKEEIEMIKRRLKSLGYL